MPTTATAFPKNLTMDNPFFDRALKQAERFLGRQQLLSDLLDRAFVRLGRLTGMAYEVHDKSLAMLRLLSAWSKGEYSGPSGRALLTFIAAAIYLVNPLDLISDFIPFVGLIDDIAVLGWVIKTLDAEIESFRTWESEQVAGRQRQSKTA